MTAAELQAEADALAHQLVGLVLAASTNRVRRSRGQLVPHRGAVTKEMVETATRAWESAHRAEHYGRSERSDGT